MGHMGYIYFVSNRDAVKIGFSVYPEKRISSIQTGCSEPVELIGYYRAAQEEEAGLHKQFAHLKVRGEWFRATPELMSLVKAKVRTNGKHEEIWTNNNLRRLRDANRGDWILVKRCNDMIAMIKNLKKLERRERDFPDAANAERNLRKNLTVAMTWLAKWASDRVN